jgi:hypothetical protein
MARLLVHVEGQTEERFVNELLRDHLALRGYESVSARIVGNARLRRHRGGIRPWPSVKADIVKHLRQDVGCIATTLVDFYGLPQHGSSAWPGRSEALQVPTRQKGPCVEQAMLENLASEGISISRRFVPFVVIHEFEGLLFSDCPAFSRAIGQPGLAASFVAIRNQF